VSEQGDRGEEPQPSAPGGQNVRSLRTSLTQRDQLVQELRIHQIELEIQNRALSEAQEQLELSRQRYVDLFDFAPVAYLTLEADGRVVEANIAAARMIGLDRSAMQGRRLQTLVGMSDPLTFGTLLRNTSEMKQEGHAELSFRNLSRKLYTVDLVATPVALAEGPGRVRVALQNVTSRVLAEQNLRFLSQAGSRLSRIPLGAPELLEEIAAAGALGSIDGCWAELDGKETVAWRSDPVRRKATGPTLQMLRLQIAQSVRETRESGGTAVGRWSPKIDPGPSSPVFMSWVSAPLRVDGGIRGTVTLFQPLTPESEEAARGLAEEFARRVSTVLQNASHFHRAEEATRARDEMMAMLTHDLSNALFSFRLHAERGLARGGDQAQRALATVARGSQWLLGMVRSVLDVSAIGTGGLTLQKHPGDLSPVLESACLLQQIDADERRLVVNRSWPDKLSFEFDQERILQVLFNLLNNALKFTPPGGRIEVGASAQGDRIHVWVKDSGKGLPASEIDRIFERGWQADPKAGGRGLGLYIARKIVEAHGGSIWVESTLGRGTTFHILLPTGAVAAGSPQEQVSDSR
jgi:PAS domain S-box-containing protein